MAALEDAGYIFQPHTSAGRVPTDAGYRYFVDALGGPIRLPVNDARRVRSFFEASRRELEDSLRATAQLLSQLTDHAALVFAPMLDRSVVRHVELVMLGSARAMVVVVTSTGQVENHIVSLPDNIDEVQLDETASMLNRVVAGTPLDAAPEAISTVLDRFPLELRETAEGVAAALTDELAEKDSTRVFLEGAANIVDEDKFADLETVRNVIEALEHKRVLFELLADALNPGPVSVRIGRENSMNEMRDCSVVTAAYEVEGEPIGSLGIVGPTRMDYLRTIASVYEVAAGLGRMLSDEDS
jgi:heat-inducible transcriptional repressor